MYSITPEQFDKFCMKRPDFGRLIRQDMENMKKRKTGNLTPNSKLADEPNCNTYASCACHAGGSKANASAGPALANGYVEAWVNVEGGVGTYKKATYHWGGPAVSVEVNRAAQQGCYAAARAALEGYCNFFTSDSC